MKSSLASIEAGFKTLAESARRAVEVFAVFELAKITKEGLEYAGSLREQAKQLGLTTKDLQVYRYAASQSGVTNEELDIGIRKLTSSLGKAQLGASQQGKVFEALGISVRDTSGNLKTADTLLPQLADKLSKMTSPTQRAAVEVGLLGRAGQQLDPLLSQGARGIEEFAKQAEDAGLIISDPVAKSAEEASHKIAAMTQELKVNFSNEVAKNADSILSLAGALEHLTVDALHFITTWPRLAGALAGAAVGARFGPIGAAVGAAGGAMVGERMREASNDANMDVGFRRDRLNTLLGAYNRAMKGGWDSQPLQVREGIIAGLRKETDLTKQAVAIARTPTLPTPKGVELPDYLGGGGGGHHRAKTGGGAAKHDPLADADLRFGEEQDRIDQEILQVKKSGLTDLNAIAAIDIELVGMEEHAKDLAIDKEVADKHIREGQGQLLKAKEATLAAAKVEQINQEKAAEQIRRDAELKIGLNDNQLNILHLQEAIAVTTGDRRKLALQELDIEKDNVRIQAQTTIDLFRKGKATKEQADLAEATLRDLDKTFTLKAKDVALQTQDPLEKYIAENDPKLIHDKIQTLEVQELESVRQGIDDAISNALGIKDPFLKGLIDLFINQVLIRPIAEALQKASAGGGGGGLGGILGSIGKLLGGGGGGGLSSGGAGAAGGLDLWEAPSAASLGLANGGHVTGPGSQTSDSIAAWLSNGEYVLNAKAVARLGVGHLDMLNKGVSAPRFANGGMVGNMPSMARNDNPAGGHTFHINVMPGGTAHERRETANQTAMAVKRVLNNR